MPMHTSGTFGTCDIGQSRFSRSAWAATANRPAAANHCACGRSSFRGRRSSVSTSIQRRACPRIESRSSDVASRYGPFDVVIDDGSHICAHVIASFRALFPHLVEDGIYAIEDLQTSYWARGYGGSSGPDRAGTSMTFLQELVDGLNYAEFDIPNYAPTYTDTWIRSLTFYHNMACVQKGANTEGSNVLQPHPRPAAILALASAPAPIRSPASPPRRWFRRLVPKRLRGVMISMTRATGRAAARALGRSHGRDP